MPQTTSAQNAFSSALPADVPAAMQQQGGRRLEMMYTKRATAVHHLPFFAAIIPSIAAEVASIARAITNIAPAIRNFTAEIRNITTEVRNATWQKRSNKGISTAKL